MDPQRKPNPPQASPADGREEDFPMQEQMSLPEAFRPGKSAGESFSERLAEGAPAIASPVLLP